MLPADGGRVINGGSVHARLLVAHDHPDYASTFEMQVALDLDVGAHVHINGEEMFLSSNVSSTFCASTARPLDRIIGNWHHWQDRAGQVYLRGGPRAFMSRRARRTPSRTRPGIRCGVLPDLVQGGHENYFVELEELLHESQGRSGPSAVRDLEARCGTEQITAMLTR